MNPWKRRLRRIDPATRRHLHLELMLLEDRSVPTVTGYRSINEVGNNVANPTWGTAGTDLTRLTPAAYADGVGKVMIEVP